MRKRLANELRPAKRESEFVSERDERRPRPDFLERASTRHARIEIEQQARIRDERKLA
jgi:hypothetical protein